MKKATKSKLRLEVCDGVIDIDIVVPGNVAGGATEWSHIFKSAIKQYFNTMDKKMIRQMDSYLKDFYGDKPPVM